MLQTLLKRSYQTSCFLEHPVESALRYALFVRRHCRMIILLRGLQLRGDVDGSGRYTIGCACVVSQTWSRSTSAPSSTNVGNLNLSNNAADSEAFAA